MPKTADEVFQQLTEEASPYAARLVRAAIYGVVPGTQRKRVAVWHAQLLAGYRAALRAARREP